MGGDKKAPERRRKESRKVHVVVRPRHEETWSEDRIRMERQQSSLTVTSPADGEIFPVMWIYPDVSKAPSGQNVRSMADTYQKSNLPQGKQMGAVPFIAHLDEANTRH
jgi:hypothetical protein